MQLSTETKKMRILIAGAGGQLRKAFTDHFSSEHQVLAFTHSDLDITDTDTVKRIISQRDLS